MTTVLAVALSLVFLPLGLAKLALAPFMRQVAAHLGRSRWARPETATADGVMASTAA